MATSGNMSTSNDRIVYAITVTQNSQSIANNTSNVTVSVRFWRTNTGYTTYGSGDVYCKINGTTYSAEVNGDHQITNSGIVLFTKTLNISHNTDGTKTLTCSAWIDHNRVTSSEQSFTTTLTTIPRKSTLSASNGTLGTAQTLTVTKKASSFTSTITYSCGSASGTVCTKATGTSISWTPPLSLASQNTTGTSVSITFTITTYNGNSSVGSNTTTITATIPASVKPTVTASISDPTGYASRFNGYAKGLSKLTVTITATPAYGAEITSYSATVDGVRYTGRTVTTGVLTGAGSAVSVTVTDARNRTVTVNVPYVVVDYNPPVISKLSAERGEYDSYYDEFTPNADGNYIRVTFSAGIGDSAALTPSYTLEYRKTTETSYTSISLTDFIDEEEVVDGTYIFYADSGSSYDVRVAASDSITVTYKTTIASTAFTLMHWAASGLGMAIGKISELDNVLDIGLRTRFQGGILQPVLVAETDLNDIRVPNTYTGRNASTYNYANCPVSSGTFVLEVDAVGEVGQTRQRLSTANKTESRTFERMFYQESWGEWICTSDYGGTLLWNGGTGGWYMNSSQTITLPEPISRQRAGIVLVWSSYNSGNNDFSCNFIPKCMITLHGSLPYTFVLARSRFAALATKYVTISDTQIVGSTVNADSNYYGVNNGITYDNRSFVLRYVIGV